MVADAVFGVVVDDVGDVSTAFGDSIRSETVIFGAVEFDVEPIPAR